MAKFAQKFASPLALAALGALALAAEPGQALTFNLGGSSASGSTLSYSAGGIDLTFLNPTGTGSNTPNVQRNINGVCSFMTFNNTLSTNSPFCGQDTNLAGGQTLTSLQLKFSQAVNLKSFTVAAATFQEQASTRSGQVGTGIVSFVPKFTNSSAGSFASPVINIDTAPISGTGLGGLSNTQFLNSNPQSPCIAESGTPDGSRCKIELGSDYIIPADSLVTLLTDSFSSTSDSEALDPSRGHWRLFALEVDPVTANVPGPLPLLGAGAALGWSRRLRQRGAGRRARNGSITQA